MDVLQLNDGTIEIIRDPRSFSEMLGVKLGSDVQDWFDKFHREYQALQSKIDELETELNSYETKYIDDLK